jgi:hypothetical protein
MVNSIQSNHNKNATKGDLVADAGEERLLVKHHHSCRKDSATTSSRKLSKWRHSQGLNTAKHWKDKKVNLRFLLKRE